MLMLLVVPFMLGVEVLSECRCFHSFNFWLGGLGPLRNSVWLIILLVCRLELKISRLVGVDFEGGRVALEQLLLPF